MTVLAAGDVSPGLLGFVVVALIGVALYFLIKSMNKQMSKIQVPREDESQVKVPHEGDDDKKAE
ncbi:hypothetical protein ACFLIM_11925 [Nonomuraea sp. M3C6]|uniref:Uncharacterized protein n=1 Tax=Nonomuraea marmarensis TaxID=3351344 RepID=A0ABW7AC63_9ACTN